MSSEDYDDLIQPEFPKKFCEFHNYKIETLINKLEMERKEENDWKDKYEQDMKKEINAFLGSNKPAIMEFIIDPNCFAK